MIACRCSHADVYVELHVDDIMLMCLSNSHVDEYMPMFACRCVELHADDIMLMCLSNSHVDDNMPMCLSNSQDDRMPVFACRCVCRTHMSMITCRCVCRTHKMIECRCSHADVSVELHVDDIMLMCLSNSHVDYNMPMCLSNSHIDDNMPMCLSNSQDDSMRMFACLCVS